MTPHRPDLLPLQNNFDTLHAPFPYGPPPPSRQVSNPSQCEIPPQTGDTETISFVIQSPEAPEQETRQMLRLTRHSIALHCIRQGQPALGARRPRPCQNRCLRLRLALRCRPEVSRDTCPTATAAQPAAAAASARGHQGSRPGAHSRQGRRSPPDGVPPAARAVNTRHSMPMVVAVFSCAMLDAYNHLDIRTWIFIYLSSASL